MQSLEELNKYKMKSQEEINKQKLQSLEEIKKMQSLEEINKQKIQSLEEIKKMQSLEDINKYKIQSQEEINKQKMKSQEEINKQKIQSQEEINDEILLKIIDKVNNLLNKFDDFYKQNWQVVMLVGNTGNGKSTIFNYLSGYDFRIRNEGCRKVLELKNPNQDGVSKIKGGSESVTKEPNYFFNQNNKHILIDFPGFNDTEGFMSQQVIQILFNRIVIKTSIKIVYVVKQSDDDLNQRGIELQNFISNCFDQKNKEFHLVTIILNSYMGDQEVDQLIKHLKSEMKEIKDNKDIALIRKIKTDEDMQKYFNKDHKDQIWKIIENSKSIQFQTAWMKKNSEIAYYINKKCIQITKKIVDEICLSIKNGLENLQIVQIKIILIHYRSIRRLTNKNIKYQNIYEWYYDLIDVCQGIAEIFQCDKALTNQISDFLKIFKFFAQEDTIINTQELLKENSDYIINELISKENTIKYTLETKQKELEKLRGQLLGRFMMLNMLFTELLLLEEELKKQIIEEKSKNKQPIGPLEVKPLCSIF